MMYYDPTNSGHGFSLYNVDNTTVGTWYAYDLNGNQVWFTLQDGKIYKPRGTGFPLVGDMELGPSVGSYEIYTISDLEGNTETSFKYRVRFSAVGTDSGFSPPPPEFIDGEIVITPLVG